MSHNIIVEGGTSVRLPTAGKYCDRDIVITAQGGGSAIEELIFALENGKQVALSSVNSIVIPEGAVQAVFCGDKILWQNALPLEYQRVAYLESTGTQYIDTGFLATSKSGFDLYGDFDYLSGATRFGTRKTPTSTANVESFCVLSIGSNRFRLACGSGSLTDTQWELTEQKRANRLVYDGVSTTATFHFVDGTFSSRTLVTYDFATDIPVLLFAFNNAGSPTLATSMRVSACKLYDNGKLMRDLIPCYRKSDGEAGMYDSVTNTFFTNAGTGAFLFAEVATEAYYKAALYEMGVKV